MSRIAVWMCAVFLLVSAACGGSNAVTEEPAPAETQANVVAVSEPTDAPATIEPMPTTAPPDQDSPPDQGTSPDQDAAAGEVAPADAEGPVRIALLDTLQMGDGQERANWARLAVEDFNDATGLNVELVEVDAGADSATIMSAMEQIVNDRAIYAVVGPYSTFQIMAAGAISEMAALPHVFFNGNPALAQEGFFRITPTDDLQGAAAARFIAETLGAQNVFTIAQAGQGAPGAYGYELFTAFSQALGAAGGAIVANAPIAADATDFSGLVADIQASGAEAIFAADTSAAQGAQIAQALRAAGVEIPLVGHYGWADTLLADAGEGVYVLSPAPAVADGAAAQRYREAHGRSGVFGPLAYAATMAALEATQRAAEAGQLSRAAVRDQIAVAQQADSVLGRPIAFTGDGNLQDAQFYVLQVRDGAFVTVAP